MTIHYFKYLDKNYLWQIEAFSTERKAYNRLKKLGNDSFFDISSIMVYSMIIPITEKGLVIAFEKGAQFANK